MSNTLHRICCCFSQVKLIGYCYCPSLPLWMSLMDQIRPHWPSFCCCCHNGKQQNQQGYWWKMRNNFYFLHWNFEWFFHVKVFGAISFLLVSSNLNWLWWCNDNCPSTTNLIEVRQKWCLSLSFFKNVSNSFLG